MGWGGQGNPAPGKPASHTTKESRLRGAHPTHPWVHLPPQPLTIAGDPAPHLRPEPPRLPAAPSRPAPTLPGPAPVPLPGQGAHTTGGRGQQEQRRQQKHPGEAPRRSQSFGAAERRLPRGARRPHFRGDQRDTQDCSAETLLSPAPRDTRPERTGGAGSLTPRRTQSPVAHPGRK